MKAAPKLEPIPVNRSFLCAMLRRAACKEKYVHVDDIEERIKTAAERNNTMRNYQLERDAEDGKNLRIKVEKFEEASGINFSRTWDEDWPVKIGEAAKIIVNNRVEEHLKSLERLHKQISGINDGIMKSISTLKEANINTPE